MTCNQFALLPLKKRYITPCLANRLRVKLFFIGTSFQERGRKVTRTHSRFYGHDHGRACKVSNHLLPPVPSGGKFYILRGATDITGIVSRLWFCTEIINEWMISLMVVDCHGRLKAIMSLCLAWTGSRLVFEPRSLFVERYEYVF